MKILLVISAWGVGGEQRAVSILVNEFIKKGYSVEILTFKILKKEIKLNRNVKLQMISENKTSPLLKNIERIKEIRRRIKKNHYDVVVGFAIIPSILVSLASIGLESITVISERSDPKIYNFVYKFFRRISYRFADGLVLQTDEAKKYFNWLKNVEKTVIKNPLDLSIIPLKSSKNSRKRIVTVGRLVEVKNHKLLIDAFKLIINDFPEYTLAIYGDGPLKNSTQNYIDELGLTENVKLYGATPSILEEIKEDEIFALTSNYEGFPNALAEAMAIGIPVVSTDCRIGGPKDLIRENRGILVEVNDTIGLSRALKKYLEDEKFKKVRSINGKEVKKELDSGKISQIWIDFFISLK